MLAFTAMQNVNVCSHHSLSRTGCLIQLGEHLCLRVIMTPWNCHSECWSKVWWWEQGQDFDQLPPCLASGGRHPGNTGALELFHLRILISSAEGSWRDSGSNLQHRRLPLKLATPTSQLTVLLYCRFESHWIPLGKKILLGSYWHPI